ncbi:hypothetical protein BC835DRAFT_1305710 [Cytidiella melzeri]|nr:hypothetical protein BC835DRAFT_1305710 [Cytidiella melzeri]
MTALTTDTGYGWAERGILNTDREVERAPDISSIYDHVKHEEGSRLPDFHTRIERLPDVTRTRVIGQIMKTGHAVTRDGRYANSGSVIITLRDCAESTAEQGLADETAACARTSSYSLSSFGRVEDAGSASSTVLSFTRKEYSEEFRLLVVLRFGLHLTAPDFWGVFVASMKHPNLARPFSCFKLLLASNEMAYPLRAMLALHESFAACVGTEIVNVKSKMFAIILTTKTQEWTAVLYDLSTKIRTNATIQNSGGTRPD